MCAHACSRMRIPVLAAIILLTTTPLIAQQKGKARTNSAGIEQVEPDTQAQATAVSSETAGGAQVETNPASGEDVPKKVTPRKKAPAASKPELNPRKETAAKEVASDASEPEEEQTSSIGPVESANAGLVEPAARAEAGTVPETAPDDIGSQSPGWMELVKTAGGMGLVITMILVGFVLFRKFAPQYAAKRPGERNLKLIETLSMGDKRSLVMVQAGARRFLLASTPGQITLLTPLADDAGTTSSHVIPPAPESAAAASGKFRNLYEMEKKPAPARSTARQELPPDIRGKMQQLRKALEG